MSDLSRLDSPELLHLALEAAGRDDHGAAISYLKQAVDLPAGEAASSTDYAKLVYMLGAEYARIRGQVLPFAWQYIFEVP